MNSYATVATSSAWPCPTTCLASESRGFFSVDFVGCGLSTTASETYSVYISTVYCVSGYTSIYQYILVYFV